VAIQRFKAILEATDGIMVARRDLEVETPTEEIALLQTNLIH
jgi:pyruvate kinase